MQPAEWTVRSTALAVNAVRVTHGPAASSDRPWLQDVLVAGPPLDQGALRVDVHDGTACVSTAAGNVVLREAQPPRLGRGGGVELRFELAPGEAFYGGGEWFDAFRRERGRVRLCARESPPLLQRRRTYSTLPFFVSSRGYGLLLLNAFASTWGIAPGRLRIRASGPPADYVVIHGPALRDVVTTYAALTGRPALPPRWAFGLWVTGFPQEHQDAVLALVDAHRRHDVPLDAVILDYHWERAFHDLRWRPSLFPDPGAFIARLGAAGVKLACILTPFLNSRNVPLQKRVLRAVLGSVPPALLRDDERALDAYAEARRRGFLAHPRTRWWFGVGGMLDFTNPRAAAWWTERLRPLHAQGVAFWKNDDGEYLPRSARCHNGLDGNEAHNLYGFYYGRAMADGMAALDDRRPLVFARSVWVGSQRHPGMFLGDQQPTFPQLRRTMRAGLNLSLAAFAYWSADVFGLFGRTTPETHARHAQWTLLLPIARYFVRPPALDRTRHPWSHGPDALASFRTHAMLRYRLLPYYYALAWEAHTTGLPLVRPLVLEFPDDERLAAVADQALLGDRLLLAPVVEPGATTRRIVLPAGTWHDFWSSASWEGPAVVDYAAPLDRLPLLVRGGTVLPLGPALPHIPGDHRFDAVELHLWPPFPADGVLYEDDGRTRAYLRGARSVTTLAAERQGDRIVVRVAAAVGRFPEQPAVRHIGVVAHTPGGLACAGTTPCPVGRDTLLSVREAGV